MAVRADDVDLVRDRDLVLRFQGGDERAFTELYLRYFDRLHRFCIKRVGDAHEAEEIAQESFVRALRAMPTLAGERRFYPWLTVIAARLCVDTHRRRARVEATDVVELGSVDGGHDDRLLAADDRRLMGQALDRLGPRHREVLVLREEQGWSYQRIADHYEVSIGTVEALLFRARKALKREFEAVAGPEGRWLALPGLGWMARRLHQLRLRVEELATQAAVPLASNAVAAAVVMSSAAVAVGIAGASDPPTIPSQVRTVAVAGADAGLGSSATDAALTRAREATTPPPAAKTETAGGGGSRPRIAGPTLTDGDRGARYTEDAPVGGGAGPVAAGLDPQVAADELEDQTAGVGRDAQAWEHETKAFADKAVGEQP